MKNILADAHCDSIEYAFDNNMDIDDRRLSFNLEDVKENMPYLQFMACFVHDKFKNMGYKRTNDILDYYLKQEMNSSNIIRINSKEDIEKLNESNNLAVMLTVENGTSLDKNINNLYLLYNKGIRMMTITWNYDNDLACGNLTSNDIGLTSFGRKCINEMNNLNMIVDVSHSSTKTFWDILSVTNKAVMASHSNVYKLCKNTRNLTDMQIKEIAKLGGLVGITYCSKFLSNNKFVSIDDVVNHIEYVCNLVGVDYVCLGSDFDGIEKENLPSNLKGIKDVGKIKECLQYRGFNKEEINKIIGGNLVNFIQNNIT